MSIINRKFDAEKEKASALREIDNVVGLAVKRTNALLRIQISFTGNNVVANNVGEFIFKQTHAATVISALCDALPTKFGTVDRDRAVDKDWRTYSLFSLWLNAFTRDLRVYRPEELGEDALDDDECESENGPHYDIRLDSLLVLVLQCFPCTPRALRMVSFLDVHVADFIKAHNAYIECENGRCPKKKLSARRRHPTDDDSDSNDDDSQNCSDELDEERTMMRSAARDVILELQMSEPFVNTHYRIAEGIKPYEAREAGPGLVQLVLTEAEFVAEQKKQREHDLLVAEQNRTRLKLQLEADLARSKKSAALTKKRLAAVKDPPPAVQKKIKKKK
jgi:hypothetical protein